MTEWIDFFLDKFPEMTKEESDYIHDILSWEDEKRSGFMFAKQVFEDDN